MAKHETNRAREPIKAFYDAHKLAQFIRTVEEEEFLFFVVHTQGLYIPMLTSSPSSSELWRRRNSFFCCTCFFVVHTQGLCIVALDSKSTRPLTIENVCQGFYTHIAPVVKHEATDYWECVSGILHTHRPTPGAALRWAAHQGLCVSGPGNYICN